MLVSLVFLSQISSCNSVQKDVNWFLFYKCNSLDFCSEPSASLLFSPYPRRRTTLKQLCGFERLLELEIPINCDSQQLLQPPVSRLRYTGGNEPGINVIAILLIQPLLSCYISTSINMKTKVMFQYIQRPSMEATCMHWTRLFPKTRKANKICFLVFETDVGYFSSFPGEKSLIWFHICVSFPPTIRLKFKFPCYWQCKLKLMFVFIIFTVKTLANTFCTCHGQKCLLVKSVFLPACCLKYKYILNLVYMIFAAVTFFLFLIAWLKTCGCVLSQSSSLK